MLARTFLRHTSRTAFQSRALSTKLLISEEVQQALVEKKPIVALESTVITHGLKFPENLDFALKVEDVVRQNGAVPATIAFIDGVPTVGTPRSALVQLSEMARPESAQKPVKVSRRDIPRVISKRLTGGTTIAGTMILAEKAGIDVFATGGLGGVHRGVEATMDVSADLDELGRTPVGVICSGPKSILDIPRTIEYLETKGVHVSTLGPEGTNIPGFFSADSGVASPYNFQSSLDVAEIIYSIKHFGLRSGAVFCVPAPEEISLPREYIDAIISAALVEADAKGITGKQVTPFLLNEIINKTGGKSLTTNVAFLLNNAAFASRVACDLTAMEGGLVESRRPSSSTSSAPAAPKNLKAPTKVDSIVIGGLAIDTTCTFKAGSKIAPTSLPGKIEKTLGGVGYNVTKACLLRGKNLGVTARLVSSIGESERAEVLSGIESEVAGQFGSAIEFDTSGLHVSTTHGSGNYVAMHDAAGELVVACADMEIFEYIDSAFIADQIGKSGPRCVLFDGNIGQEQMVAAIRAARTTGAIVGFEPTSVKKAAALAGQPFDSLKRVLKGVVPANSVDFATPNFYELTALHEQLAEQEYFDVDSWFPIIDALSLGDTFRSKVEAMARSTPQLRDALLRDGVAQKAIQVLPYIPHLFVKLGADGVLLFQLLLGVDAVAAQQSQACGSDEVPPLAQVFHAARSDVGLLIQHFPAVEVDPAAIASVTGAGDTFCGFVLAETAANPAWLYSTADKVRVMDKAQLAARLTLETKKSVSEKILDIA